MISSDRVRQLPEECLANLIQWAQRTGAVRELWLFGSRAKGTHHPGSDVDLAVALMPKDGDHDWAFGDYVALADDTWKPELRKIVGRPISFGAITPGDKMDAEVRETGILLWQKDGRL
jgi:predicted nucleotidyltransferase